MEVIYSLEQCLGALWIFFVGSSVGSYINVIIDRPLSESLRIKARRSHCATCDRNLAFYDLIPVLSYVFLRGSCRFCRAPIPKRMVVVEAAFGFFALWCAYASGVFLRGTGFISAGFLFLSISCAIAIMIIDWRFWIIPLPLSIGLALCPVLKALLLDESLIDAVMGSVMGLVIFASVLVVSSWLLRRRGRLQAHETALGLGDVWLLTAIGANVGIVGLSPVMLLASLQAIAAWLIIYKTKPETLAFIKPASAEYDMPAHAIPFGAFLALAMIEVLLFRPAL